MSSNIRLAEMDDLSAIERIVEAAYSPYVARIGQRPGPMLDDYASLIRRGFVSVLEREGNICGLLVLVPEAECMLLDNIAVAPDARGTGVGRQLLQYAEQVARESGFEAIRLYTHVLMTENIALYGRIGYRETHRGKDNGFERVFMTKPLGRSADGRPTAPRP